MAAVVLDAGAVAELAHHLEVEGRPLPKAGALQGPALVLELADPLLHLGLDVDDRLAELLARRHEVGRRVDVEVLALGEQLAGQRIELGDPLDLVAEELDPDDELLRWPVRISSVSPRTRNRARLSAGVVALVLEVDEVAQHRVAPVLAADPSLSTVAP